LKVPEAAAPDQQLTVLTILIAARFTTVHEFRKRFWQLLKVQRGFLVGTRAEFVAIGVGLNGRDLS
jgi:hypothetical protein